jgi:3-hydroxyisobutyrate dehydrogenase-like beta-hydroxyacid dehydrogenase
LNVGVIGARLLGTACAKRLMQAGFEVIVPKSTNWQTLGVSKEEFAAASEDRSSAKADGRTA